MSAWGGWSQCSKSCEPEIQTATRQIQIQPMHDGQACPNERSRKRDCDQKDCTGVYVKLKTKTQIRKL